MEFPDATPAWPTHGAGSFCSASGGGDRLTTTGRERQTNPPLQVSGQDRFVDALLSMLGTFPDYFLPLGDFNRHGPAVLDAGPGLTPVSVQEVSTLIKGGAMVIDARPAVVYTHGHIPASLSIPLRPAFATWPRWLTTR